MGKKFSEVVLEDTMICENGIAAVLHFSHLIRTRCGISFTDCVSKPSVCVTAVQTISTLESVGMLDDESYKVFLNLGSMMMACKVLSEIPAYSVEGRYSQDVCNLQWEEYTLLKKIVHSNVFGKLFVSYSRWLSEKYKV